MAQKGADLDQETLGCSICLDLLKDPVTIPCGHSYCMKCIQGFWDGVEKVPCCPQCRKIFIPRPVLVKNFMLAALVDQLKKTGLQAAPAALCYAGPEDVVCDVCTGRKLKAIKSCLVCLASYCEEHLQPHLDAAALQKHKLVEPSKNLQENICSRHHEVSQKQIQQRIQDREKEVKLLQQKVEAISRSADQTVEDSEKIFTEMIRLIQNRRRDVKQQIRSQQQTEVRRVKDLQEELEQEITELKRRDAELKRRDAELKHLSLTEDHSHFLLYCPPLPPLSEATPTINVRPLRYFEDVTAAVSELRDKLQDILRETNISLTVARVDVLLSEPEPKSRADFLRYSRQIRLDPNTAHSFLLLSEENRKVTYMGNPQAVSDHPDRFTDYDLVLSRESLTGRCYWEVEQRGLYVYVIVAYKNISRSGRESLFGFNDKSWALVCSQNRFSFLHNSIRTSISAPVPSRVGVYLDHRAGVLSFYSVSESMTLLHRVQTTFTQPLHAGLGLDFAVGDTAEFCKVK